MTDSLIVPLPCLTLTRSIHHFLFLSIAGVYSLPSQFCVSI